MCFINVTVAVSNGTHEVVVSVTKQLDDWNQLRSQFDEQDFNRIIYQSIGSRLEILSFKAESSVFLEEIESHQATQIRQMTSQIGIFNFNQGLSEEDKTHILDVNRSHGDNI